MARYYFNAQQRLFEYRGYTVLVKEQYNPWADTPGYPSLFIFFYVETHKSAMIMRILSALPWEKISDDLLNQYGVKFGAIENKGFWSKHDINWAVEEAKKLI